MRPFQKVVRSLRRRQNITTAGEYLFRIFIMIMILFDLFVAVYAGTVNQKMELFLFSIALRIITALLIIYLILKANHLLIDDFQAARYLDVWNADKTDTYQNAVELLGNTSASEIILERIFHRADLRTREQKMTPDNSGLKLVMLVFLTLLIANLSLLLLAPYTMAQAYDFYKLNHLPAVVHKQFVEVTPGDLQITLNSDVVIEVVDPEPEVDHVLFYKRGENWREEKLIDHKRRFVNVDFSFLYYVRTPYAASDTFAVQVFEIPAIRNIDLLYDYPAYTDLADYLEENSSGNIKALRNTRVTLDISANNPITTADIVFS
ncbi:MAG: hypothetical protein JXB60_09825, partial [Candidatus Cloacimonetes bacterium]|nr:hypothetical protein [Candidatus Cloacimonadota bacterium]